MILRGFSWETTVLGVPRRSQQALGDPGSSQDFLRFHTISYDCARICSRIVLGFFYETRVLEAPRRAQEGLGGLRKAQKAPRLEFLRLFWIFIRILGFYQEAQVLGESRRAQESLVVAPLVASMHSFQHSHVRVPRKPSVTAQEVLGRSQEVIGSPREVLGRSQGGPRKWLSE